MTKLQNQLISKAKEKFGDIHPCGEKTSLLDCFTRDCGKIIFWFNIASDSSTRVLMALEK